MIYESLSLIFFFPPFFFIVSQGVHYKPDGFFFSFAKDDRY